MGPGARRVSRLKVKSEAMRLGTMCNRLISKCLFYMQTPRSDPYVGLEEKKV